MCGLLSGLVNLERYILLLCRVCIPLKGRKLLEAEVHAAYDQLLLQCTVGLMADVVC